MIILHITDVNPRCIFSNNRDNYRFYNEDTNEVQYHCPEVDDEGYPLTPTQVINKCKAMFSCKNVMIRTTSEHILLWLLTQIRLSHRDGKEPQLPLATNELRIFYWDYNQCKEIDVDINGDLIQPWPSELGYFEERFNLLFT